MPMLPGPEIVHDLHDRHAHPPVEWPFDGHRTRSPGEPGGALCAEAPAVRPTAPLLRGDAGGGAGRGRSEPRGWLSARSLTRLTEHVDAHLNGSITLSDLACVVGVGVRTLSRQLRRTLGCSAHAFVVGRRLRCARRLLREARLPIKDVAAAAGFADQAHLTRTFHARCGTTPAKYRRGA